jgi:hypothetical protein
MRLISLVRLDWSIFTIIVPDRSSLDTIRSIIYDSVTFEQQEKHNLHDENNKNQILIKDPDGIQILIKLESE